jgi:hypothetical protein
LTGDGSGLEGTMAVLSIGTIALGGYNGNVVDTTDPDDLDYGIVSANKRHWQYFSNNLNYSNGCHYIILFLPR